MIFRIDFQTCYLALKSIKKTTVCVYVLLIKISKEIMKKNFKQLFFSYGACLLKNIFQRIHQNLISKSIYVKDVAKGHQNSVLLIGKYNTSVYHYCILYTEKTLH